jgi:hypothetical protein
MLRLPSSKPVLLSLSSDGLRRISYLKCCSYLGTQNPRTAEHRNSLGTISRITLVVPSVSPKLQNHTE